MYTTLNFLKDSQACRDGYGKLIRFFGSSTGIRDNRIPLHAILMISGKDDFNWALENGCIIDDEEWKAFRSRVFFPYFAACMWLDYQERKYLPRCLLTPEETRRYAIHSDGDEGEDNRRSGPYSEFLPEKKLINMLYSATTSEDLLEAVRFAGTFRNGGSSLRSSVADFSRWLDSPIEAIETFSSFLTRQERYKHDEQHEGINRFFGKLVPGVKWELDENEDERSDAVAGIQDQRRLFVATLMNPQPLAFVSLGSLRLPTGSSVVANADGTYQLNLKLNDVAMFNVVRSLARTKGVRLSQVSMARRTRARSAPVKIAIPESLEVPVAASLGAAMQAFPRVESADSNSAVQ